MAQRKTLELLHNAESSAGAEALQSALRAEDPLGKETLAAIIRRFVELTIVGPAAALPVTVAVVIQVLEERHDYETLFKLAACTAVPGRSPFLTEKCLEAVLAAGAKQDIYDLLLDQLDCDANEPVRTAVLSSAARIMLRLAEGGFEPAYLTLADLFQHGIGVPRELQKAQSWYLHAALANTHSASAAAIRTASAYRELLELMGDRLDVRAEEFFRLQAELAEEFAKRAKAIIPSQIVDCLIERGESGRVEFKATLRWDLKTQKVNKELEITTIQELASFMNSDGGSLFIGVSNERQVLGLNLDYQSFTSDKTRDKFERHLRTLLRNAFGVNADLCAVDFFNWGEKEFCKITVRRAQKLVLIAAADGTKQLWIREGNAKRVLQGPELETYVANRVTAPETRGFWN